MTVIWKKNGLRLTVIKKVKGHLGEPRFRVCKTTSTQPGHGIFSIRCDEAIVLPY